MSDDIKMNYPSNAKQLPTPAPVKEEKKVEKVISGEVVKRKPPLGRKIAETFSGDDMKSVGGYILFDVVIPQVKDLIYDVCMQGLQRKMYGEGARRSSGVRPSSGGGSTRYTSYNKVGTEARQLSHKARANHNFDEVILADRGEAEMVIERLGDLISEYDVATVADLYDMVDVTGSFTDNKYGWTSMSGSRIVRVRDGFLLDLPKPGPID